MGTNVERISSVATSLNHQGSPQSEGGSHQTPAPVRPNLAAADYRLVIEQDPRSGSFVYKTLDRMTGEVVSQFPREELLKLQQDAGYVAGTVIATKA